MSSLSSRLLAEMNNDIESVSEDDEVLTEDIDINLEIEVKFEYIEGLRKGSKLVWAFENRHLYYINAYSKKTKLTACTCYDPKCTARIYIRENNTGFQLIGSKHVKAHGSHYEIYKRMYCCNKMKRRATNAPASMTSHEIYKEVLKE